MMIFQKDVILLNYNLLLLLIFHKKACVRLNISYLGMQLIWSWLEFKNIDLQLLMIFEKNVVVDKKVSEGFEAEELFGISC